MLALVVGGLVTAAAVHAARRRPRPAVHLVARAVVGVFALNLAVGLLNMWWLAPVPVQLVHLLLADLAWIGLVVLSASALADACSASRSLVLARQVLCQHAAAVLVVVAVGAQVLPVAAVRWVVVVVAVAVVDGEQVEV